MVWWLAATVLFGILSVLLAAGLPAAFAFLGINVVGAWVWLGGDAGLVQMVRNGVASIASFSLTPIPFFVLMGEVLFHTGVAMKAIDAIDRLIARVPGRLSVVAMVEPEMAENTVPATTATTESRPGTRAMSRSMASMAFIATPVWKLSLIHI